MNENKLYTPQQLSKLIGVTQQTLLQWANDGKLQVQKTQGGHRRYVYANLTNASEARSNEKKQFIYARVSSAKQHKDLQRQIALLQTNYPTFEVIQDIGSGINFRRRGLMSLLERVFEGNVSKVVVAHRDRLTRFGFELFEYIFTRFGVSIEVLSDEDIKEPHTELAKDLLSIVTVFSARYYGSRNYSDMQESQVLSKPRPKKTLKPMPRRIKVFLQQSNRKNK